MCWPVFFGGFKKKSLFCFFFFYYFFEFSGLSYLGSRVLVRPFSVSVYRLFGTVGGDPLHHRLCELTGRERRLNRHPFYAVDASRRDLGRWFWKIDSSSSYFSDGDRNSKKKEPHKSDASITHTFRNVTVGGVCFRSGFIPFKNVRVSESDKNSKASQDESMLHSLKMW